MYQLNLNTNDLILTSKACFQQADRHRLLIRRARNGDMQAQRFIKDLYNCHIFSPKERAEFIIKKARKMFVCGGRINGKKFIKKEVNADEV